MTKDEVQDLFTKAAKERTDNLQMIKVLKDKLGSARDYDYILVGRINTYTEWLKSFDAEKGVENDNV